MAKTFRPATAAEYRQHFADELVKAQRAAQVPAPREHREGVVKDLVDRDTFSVDGGKTWYVCCIVMFDTVSVYIGPSRSASAKTIRVEADDDAPCLVGVRRITSEHGRPAAADDEVGRIRITFRNAINGRRVCRYRSDIVAARQLVAHFRPYNNTDIYADVVTDTDGITTQTEDLDLKVDGRFVFCRCFNDDEEKCTRADELAAEIGGAAPPQ